MEMCVFVDGHLRITLTTNSTEKMENSSWCKTDCFSSHRGLQRGSVATSAHYQRAFLVRVSSLTRHFCNILGWAKAFFQHGNVGLALP